MMMKVRLGRKSEESPLHPLSEKEIQKKLYGSFHDPAEINENPEAELLSFRRKEKKERRVTFSIPWRKIGAVCLKALKALAGFSKILLSKVATRWGMGALVVVVLFLGIHALNAYRATAMKAPKAVTVPVEPVHRQISRKTREAQAAKLPLSAQTLTSPTPVLEEASPPPPAKKPYVIQVATYATPWDAQKLVDQMKSVRLPAFVQSFDRAARRTFYLVFLGRFETFQEAQNKFKEFREKPIAKDFPDSFIRVL